MTTIETVSDTKFENQLDSMCVNALRFLAVDSVQKAESGHPGFPLGAASMAYALWDRFLKYNPSDPNWHDRDRFVLSAGTSAGSLPSTTAAISSTR